MEKQYISHSEGVDAFNTSQLLAKFKNCWRSFRTTTHGKRAGNCPSWDKFDNFYNDMWHLYFKNATLVRKDRAQPFSPSNCLFVNRSCQRLFDEKPRQLTYNDETLTLKEWAIKLGINLTGVVKRYHSKKAHTVEEILFGRSKQKREPRKNILESARASKLASAYRVKDTKRQFENNITGEYLLHNIINKPCYYCGGVSKIGADRIDNTKGHTVDNVLPCCYTCNIVRNTSFTVDEMVQLGKVIANIKAQRINNLNQSTNEKRSSI